MRARNVVTARLGVGPFLRRSGAALGSVFGTVLLAGGVFVLEAWRAWSTATSKERAMLVPDASGRYGDYDGEAIRIAMVGDSLAVGFGVDTPEETVAGRMAAAVAGRLHRAVEIRSVAEVGARSRDLAGQLERLAQAFPAADVAVVVIGSNDVLGMAGVSRSSRLLYETVRRLRSSGTPVVVATCPDLGTLRLFVPPLRWLVGRVSRSMAVAQTRVVVAAGGSAVPLGTTLGPLFWHKPALMFAGDRFHPSALGYARAAAVVTPSVIAAVSGRVPRGS